MSLTDTRFSTQHQIEWTDERKVLAAILASLLFHVLVVLLISLWKWASPAASPAPDAPLEVTLVPAQEKPKPVQLARLQVPTPVPKPQKSFIDSDGLQKSTKAPDDATIESDVNMTAASELPATGAAPLPTQQGKQRPFAQFENRNYSLGKEGKSADTRPEMKFVPQQKPAPQTAPGQQQAAKAEQTPEPLPKPTPVFRPQADATPEPDTLPMSAATPTPDSQAKPTPSETLAMLRPQQRPVATPQPQTQPSKASGYQPQRERTTIEGSISNRGKASVNAIGTPLGRYRKLIADAIGSRWYFYVNQRMDLITIGSVHIKFLVDENGHVEQVRVLSNSSNETFANYSVQSILEAKMPPLPKEAVPLLDNGRLEVEYNFTIYPN